MNKVFISYAKEDFKFAKRLFDFLKLNHFSPWLDKECLMPGQNWDFEINKELRKADFIILLISKTSIKKRGYIQKEYKLALKFYEEKLEDDIYLLPLKIDNCEVPFGFEKFQWHELNGSYDFYKILDSLNYQRKKIELDNNQIYNPETDFEYQEKKIIKEIGLNPKKNIEIHYPQFSNTINEDLLLINSSIENKVLSIYSNFISPFPRSLTDTEEHNDEYIERDYELIIKYNFEVITEEIICLTIFTSIYTGGAHGNYWTLGLNYRLNPFMNISLKDIFKENDESLKSLTRLIKNEIKVYANDKLGIKNVSDFYLNPLKNNWDEIGNITISKEGLIFIFHIYQITAYALGEHKILLKYKDLINTFPDSRALKFVKEKITNAKNV